MYTYHKKTNASIFDILHIFIIHSLLDTIFIRDALLVVLLNYYMHSSLAWISLFDAKHISQIIYHFCSLINHFSSLQIIRKTNLIYTCRLLIIQHQICEASRRITTKHLRLNALAFFLHVCLENDSWGTWTEQTFAIDLGSQWGSSCISNFYIQLAVWINHFRQKKPEWIN